MRSPTVLRLIVPLLAAASLSAAEGWRPAEHPAVLVRELSATTRPRRTLVVAAEVSGRLLSLRGEVGEVTGREPVAVIDDSAARFARDSAIAALDVAVQAELVAIANAEAAKIETAFRGREVDRLVSLGESVSSGQLDHGRHAARVAELSEQASQAARRQATSQLAAATTARDKANDDLTRYRIAAPPGWTILKRHVEDGSVISSGQALLTLGDCRTLTCDLQVDDYELAALRSGKTVEVRFRQGGAATATLARVAADVDAGTRRRHAELDLPADQAPEASGGLEATIAVALPDPSQGVFVPLSALKAEGGKITVALDGGHAVPVTVLRRQGGFAVIRAGDLPPGAVLAP